MGLILLVRHGQASWGAADYDQLSPLGERQAELLGSWLAKGGVRPNRLVGGSMKRHRQTAVAAAAGAGWPTDLEVDDGWDEFDHVRLMEVHGARTEHLPADAGHAELDAWFDAAVARWVSGEHDADYPESFPDFTARVEGALRRTADAVGPGETVVVFTSGGPISWSISSLVAAATATWQRLNPVLVNSSVSKVTIGTRGATAVSFNEHPHLPADLLTYR
jgi:broad specificity phosphatase PhoE